jgi:hypothetical protein
MIDNASPISSDNFLKWLPEPYETLDKDSFSYNPNVKIHVKKYPNRLSHRFGATRLWTDFMIFSYANYLDYIVIEGDALIAYNILEDFKGFEFVAKTIHHGDKPPYIQSLDMWCIFVDKNNLTERVINPVNIGRAFPGGPVDCNLPWYFSHDRDTIYELGEGDMYRFFCRGRFREITKPNKFIHDSNHIGLKNFILENKIEHSLVDNFLEKLDEKIKRNIC